MNQVKSQCGTQTPSVLRAEQETSNFGVAAFVENFIPLAGAAEGIERLRGLVIELAIRGRLTEARDGDEPAQILVARAASTLGKGRTRRVLTAPMDRQTPLPTGWMWCEPQDLGVVAPRNEIDDGQDVGFVPMTVVPTDYRRAVVPEVRTWSAIKKGYTHLADGDIAVAKITPCFQNGKSCVMKLLHGGVGAGTTELLVLRPVPGVVEPNYLLLFFKSPDFIAGGVARMTGTAGQQRVPADYFAAVPLPLPPLAEQKRIVAKVDQLMALCDELEAREIKKRNTSTRLTKSALEALTTANGPEEFDIAWKRVVENFDVVLDGTEKVGELRKVIVDLASRGNLTRRTGATARPVIELRQRERRTAWEATQLAKFEREGRRPRDERWKAEYEDPTYLQGDDLPALPNGWAYAAIGTLGTDPFCPVQTGPFGAQLHSREFTKTGVPVIAVGNLTWHGFSTNGLYFISDEKAAQLSRYDVQAGDLLFARSGATLGKVCVAPPEVRDWRMTGHILRVRLDPRAIRADVAALWLWASVAVTGQVQRTTRGGTRPGYNTSLLENIVLPIPPLDEQQLIVETVERLMSLCDELEGKLTRAADHASKLVAAVVRELVA